VGRQHVASVTEEGGILKGHQLRKHLADFAFTSAAAAPRSQDERRKSRKSCRIHRARLPGEKGGATFSCVWRISCLRKILANGSSVTSRSPRGHTACQCAIWMLQTPLESLRDSSAGECAPRSEEGIEKSFQSSAGRGGGREGRPRVVPEGIAGRLATIQRIRAHDGLMEARVVVIVVREARKVTAARIGAIDEDPTRDEIRGAQEAGQVSERRCLREGMHRRNPQTCKRIDNEERATTTTTTTKVKRVSPSTRPFTQPRVFALQLARQIRVWPLPARPLDSPVTRATSSLRFATFHGYSPVIPRRAAHAAGTCPATCHVPDLTRSDPIDRSESRRTDQLAIPNLAGQSFLARRGGGWGGDSRGRTVCKVPRGRGGMSSSMRGSKLSGRAISL